MGASFAINITNIARFNLLNKLIGFVLMMSPNLLTSYNNCG